MTRKLLLIFAVGLFSANGLFAQSVGQRITVKGDANYSAPTEGKLASKLMARDMPYRVILPTDYSAAKDKRFPVLYLLHGLTGSYRNWTDLSKLPIYAQNFNVIIVTPEGQNGWYSDSPVVKNAQFESYIVKELIPEIDAKYRTLAKRESRVIAGLSMGGYGALKFGVKYSEMFALVGSFSGALGVTDYKMSEGGFVKTIEDAFGPAGSDARKTNDLFALVRDASSEKIKTLPFIYLDCGTEDFLFQNNRDFLSLLIDKKVPHEYRQLPGAHDWKYWDKQVQEFLQVASQRISGIGDK